MRWLCSGGVLAAFVLAGCRTVPVHVAVARPALVNLKSDQHVIVDHVDGELGKDVADAIQNKLQQQDKVKVQPREALSKKSAPKNAAAITGTARGVYQERVETTELDCYNGNVAYKCNKLIRKGSYEVSGSLKVTDLATGKRLGEVPVSCTRQAATEPAATQPPAIDVHALGTSCANQIASGFVTSLAPHHVVMQLPFRTNSALPTLEHGIDRVKDDDLKNAILIFKAATTAKDVEPDLLADAWWDLGLAYEADNQVEASIAALKEAQKLDPENEKYARKIARVSGQPAEQQAATD